MYINGRITKPLKNITTITDFINEIEEAKKHLETDNITVNYLDGRLGIFENKTCLEKIERDKK